MQSQSSKESPWNSLEIAKLVVGVATPITIFLLGQQFASASHQQSIDDAIAAQKQAEASAKYEKVVEKREQLWGQIAIPLNDIYAYMLQVGSWKELTATDVIARKRQIDAIVYANRPFFSDDFLNAYDAFMRSAFCMNCGGWGQDAPLRTMKDLQFKDKDDARFTDENNREAIHDSYYRLLKVVASELDLKIGPLPLPPARKQKQK